MKPHTLVLGLGNPLMADDGVGPAIIERLRQESVPAGVVIQDGGTAGIGLVPEMEGYQRLILVDSALMGARPGEWRRFSLAEANLLGDDAGGISLHSANLRDALRLAEALGILPPEVVVYAMQPANLEWDQPMSEQVAAAIPAVAAAVMDQIHAVAAGHQPDWVKP